MAAEDKANKCSMQGFEVYIFKHSKEFFYKNEYRHEGTPQDPVEKTRSCLRQGNFVSFVPLW